MGFLFLTPEKLSRLADNLRQGNSVELRHEAFDQLARLPPGELLGHESWPQLKPVLEAALNGRVDRVRVRLCVHGCVRMCDWTLVGHALKVGKQYTNSSQS